MARPPWTRSWRSWLRAEMTRSPAALVLLLVLVVTTLLLRGLDGQTATRVLRTASTNLVHMSADAPRVLFLSAFLLDSGNPLAELAKTAFILIPFERLVRTARAVAVFAAGHIGATMVTTVGIWWEVRAGAGSRELVYPVDVGVSYGLYACAGAAVASLRRTVGIPVALALIALACAGIVRSGTFTDWGHLGALAIGLACGPVVAAHRTPDDPVTLRRRRTASLAITFVLLVAAGALVEAALVDGRTSTELAAPTDVSSARVVGQPAGCGPLCDQAVVRVRSGDTTSLATVKVPRGTFVRRGDQLPTRLVSGRSATLTVARRTDVQGLFAAAAVICVVVAFGLLLIGTRSTLQP